MGFLDVRTTMNTEAKELMKLIQNPRRLAAITAAAINSTLAEGRKRAIAAAAQDVNLPVATVQRMKSRHGSKVARSEIDVRAAGWRLWAQVSVAPTGIPAHQLGGRQTRAGYKAKGKLFPGAFRVPKGQYAAMVFKRIRPKSEGSTKQELVLPRVRLREALVRRFDQYITGMDGQRIFRRQYIERVRRELGRAGVKA